jgi:hypothetical protein
MKKCGHCETLGEAGTVCRNCGGRGCHDTDTTLPVYNVRVTETVTYIVPVEAKSEDDALEAACGVLCDLDDQNQYFDDVEDRHAVEVVQ